MIEIKGNYWQAAEQADCLVVTTNGVVKKNGSLVMGKGIAKAFNEKFLDLDMILGQMAKYGKFDSPNGIPKYGVLRVTVYDKPIVALQTKYHWFEPSFIELIKFSCKALLDLADLHSYNKILMTRPGCGNGGLNWKDVRETISFLDDRFLVVDKKES